MAPRKTVRFAGPQRKRRRICSAADKSLAQEASKHEGIIQSLELMKIALHACLATLSYVRELLHRDVFGWRQLPDLLPGENYSYDEFIRGKSVKENKRKHEPIRAMERGMDDAADKILDLLEEGIFDALVRRSLAAVQFRVTLDTGRPDTAVETYTITMGSGGKYGNAVGLGTGVDCCFDEETGGAVAMGEVEKDIVSMNRNLTTMLEDSPEIHGPRVLGVQLFYTDDCPERYKAYGFADVDSDVNNQTLLFPVDDWWARVGGLHGLINCGFYTATVRVSWLQCSPWLMLCLHGKNCPCKSDDELCHDWQPLPMPLCQPLVFEEVVLRKSEFGLPWADEVNGEEDSLSD